MTSAPEELGDGDFPGWIQNALDSGLITTLDARQLATKAIPLRHGSPLQLLGKGGRGHVACRCRFSLGHSCTALPPVTRMSL